MAEKVGRNGIKSLVDTEGSLLNQLIMVLIKARICFIAKKKKENNILKEQKFLEKNKLSV